MCLIDFVFDHVVLLLGNFPATSYLLAQATIPRRGLGDGSRAYLVRRGDWAPLTGGVGTGGTLGSVGRRGGAGRGGGRAPVTGAPGPGGAAPGPPREPRAAPRPPAR